MNRPALARFPRLCMTVAVVSLAILACRDAAAQADAVAGAGGTVTGSGAVTVSRQPNVLRMTIELPAEGKDIKEAIANLKKERMALAAKIEKLGAAKDKVTFSEPRVGGQPGGSMNAQRQMMRQMVRMQRAGGRAAAGKEAADGAPPPKVAVSLTVTAEWPLAEQSPEEFVVAGYTLREKLRAAGLSKPPEPKELTPEEQEEMEELAGMMDEEEGAAAPGEPSFVFVSRFTAEERDNAMAEAFKKARAEATRLATAAAGTLGDLRTVNGSTSADGAGDDDVYGYQRAMMIQMGMNPADPGVEEGTTSEPGPVSMRVTVTATFGMK